MFFIIVNIVGIAEHRVFLINCLWYLISNELCFFVLGTTTPSKHSHSVLESSVDPRRMEGLPFAMVILNNF